MLRSMYATCCDWESFKQIVFLWFIDSVSIANFRNQ